MSELLCPHCRSEVPYGAKVCRGCQAEIEYGCPPVLFFILVAACGFLGSKVADFMPTIFGWATFIGGVIAGGIFLSKVFSERVVFKRLYKTK